MKGHSFHPHSGYNFFFGGLGEGEGGGGGTAVEGWILLKEMMLYFGQPARAIMGLGSQSI